MSFRTRRGLKSALVHRVRRHASMATLFRAIDPLPVSGFTVRVEAGFGETTSLSPERIVQATLVPVPTTLPPGYMVESHPVAREVPSPVNRPVQQVPTPFTQVETPPVGEYAAQQDKPQGESETDEIGWQRLKSIFRRHQERRVQKETTDPLTETSLTPVQRESEPQPAQSPGRYKAEVHGSEKIDSIESRTAATPLHQDIPDHQPMQGSRIKPVEDAPAPRLQKEQTSHPASTPQEQASDPATRLGGRHQEVSKPKSSTGAVEKNLASDASTESSHQAIPETVVQLQADPEIRTISNHSRPHPEGDEQTTQPTPSVQSLPLEDVWPVQRQEIPPAMAKFTHSADVPEIDIEPPMISSGPEHLEFVRDESIHRALSDVAPDRPTDSSIEVITPRRPRPVASPAKTIPLSPSVQRDQLGDTPGEATILRLPSDPALDETQAVQREASERRPRSDTTEEIAVPDLVQTDIGPLPADLWHLLGQSPPRRSRTEGTSPKPAKTSTGGDAIAAAETKPILPEPPSLGIPDTQESVGVPSSIQRVVNPAVDAGEEAAAAHQPEVGGAELAVGEVSPAPELDTDELARQVYAEIKRRVTIEWERSRWRA